MRVGIVGVTGYTGEELLRILGHHPHVQLAYLAASSKWGRPTPVSEVYPRYRGQLDLPVEAFDSSQCSQRCDAVFLALPHGTAMEAVPSLLAAGKKVIDLSGDFRLHDPAAYPAWYKFSHTHPKLLTSGTAVYGLTEFYKPQIAKASLVSNPGCYATSVLLAVLPLAKANLLDGGRFIVDAKSGLSGAGRKADQTLLYAEMTENLRAYKVNDHQHMPEIAQAIREVAGAEARLVFVPQMIPATRGLISMVYVSASASLEKIQAAFAAAYPRGAAPFVRVRPGGFPQLTDVVQTNFCDIGFAYDASTQTIIIGSALDNLVKGAAGQAVQNLNVMHGWPETTGLL